jgi:hypothetical protein
MKKLKISNSALDCYVQCPKKYHFKYVENLKGDYTSTPLLFGSAIDAALNYILESIRDKKEWQIETACTIFDNKMQEWHGQNKLEFFKNEVPEALQASVDEHNPDHQEEVWKNICKRGLDCLFVYDKEIIPLIEEVVSVQNRGTVLNEDGDEFVFVVDFIAKLKDGRTVLFDNKTASAKYKKKAVIESQQLSLYMEQFPQISLAGYIVLIKNPEKEKGLTYQILIDEIPEETRKKSFDLLDQTMYDIKQEKFPCNYKSCKAFGKPCEYERACSFGDYSGLVPNKIDKEPK